MNQRRAGRGEDDWTSVAAKVDVIIVLHFFETNFHKLILQDNKLYRWRVFIRKHNEQLVILIKIANLYKKNTNSELTNPSVLTTYSPN